MAINNVTLSGNLTRDAELRRTQSGMAVLNASLAVNNRRKNPQTGQWEDEPMYIDLCMFGSRAESVHKYLTKGAKIAVQGRLRFSSWERDGQRRSKHDVIVDEIEFLSRNQGGGQNTYDDRASEVRREQAQYVEATYYEQDEIPF